MVYLEVIKLNAKQVFVYPYEVIATIISKFLRIASLLLFWTILTSTSETNLNTRELLSYFLIAGGVSEFVMATNLSFGKNTLRKIKNGEINSFALRPLNLIYYLYWSYVGSATLDYILAFISIIIGIVIFPPTSVFAIVLSLTFLVIATILSLSINILTATLGFMTTEASSIKNVLVHIIKVLSGTIVPISFFPGISQMLIKLTPFPFLVYGPTQALRENTLTNEVLLNLSLGIFWMSLLYITAHIAWNKLFKKYEAIGI